MRVELLEASNPCIVLVAIKTSQGGVYRNGLGRYWPVCDSWKLRRWMLDAAEKYPSVLEHFKATWLVDDVTRVCSHQLVRHRVASYTQESQRYTEDRILDAGGCLCRVLGGCGAGSGFGGIAEVAEKALRLVGSWIRQHGGEGERILACLGRAFDVYGGCSTAAALEGLRRYAERRARGEPPEAARYELPQCTKTTILVTMNLREFLHFYLLRSSPKAQAEIRLLAEKMKETLEDTLPWIHELARVYSRRLYHYPR